MPWFLIVIGLVVQFLGIPSPVSAAIVPVRKVEDGMVTTHLELHYMAIRYADCEAQEFSHLTGIYVDGFTNENPNELVAYSEVTEPRKGMNGLPFLVQPFQIPENGEKGFRYNPLLATHANAELCPLSVTIRGADGLKVVAKIAVYTFQ